MTGFLRDRRRSLFLHFAAMAALSIFLRVTGTQSGVVVLILVAWVLGLALFLCVDFWRRRARLREMESIMDGLDKKYLWLECVPKPASAYERKLFALARRAGKSMIEKVSQAETAQAEYREYIEDWVHEIKTPITAAQLVCNNHKSDSARKILLQLSQIEEHVERVLYYARAGGVERDFIVRKTVLADIVADAVAKQQVSLIQNGIRVETPGDATGLERVVYTDGKWVAFMLGQLLSNAIRYKKENPVIRFEAREDGDRVCLTVTDNGMGIPSAELPRIFERGFTGHNGRERGNATGMGLYIVKKLAGFLQITLDITSEQGAYTAVCMSFPAERNLSKM